MKRFNFRDITDAFRIAKEPKTPAPSQYSRSVIWDIWQETVTSITRQAKLRHSSTSTPVTERIRELINGRQCF